MRLHGGTDALNTAQGTPASPHGPCAVNEARPRPPAHRRTGGSVQATQGHPELLRRHQPPPHSTPWAGSTARPDRAHREGGQPGTPWPTPTASDVPRRDEAGLPSGKWAGEALGQSGGRRPPRPCYGCLLGPPSEPTGSPSPLTESRAPSARPRPHPQLTLPQGAPPPAGGRVSQQPLLGGGSLEPPVPSLHPRRQAADAGPTSSTPGTEQRARASGPRSHGRP